MGLLDAWPISADGRAMGVGLKECRVDCGTSKGEADTSTRDSRAERLERMAKTCLNTNEWNAGGLSRRSRPPEGKLQMILVGM